MMRFFRKHRNTLMIVIAVLAVPFIFYFNKTDFSARREADFGTVYDRKISMAEAGRYGRLYGLAMALGMSRFVQDLTAGAREDNQRAVEFILNLIILEHEGDRLGIEPGSSEVTDTVRNMQAFRGPSGFDIKQYDEFVQERLAPNGFSEAQIEQLARDELRLNRIKDLVGMAVSVPESEAKTNFEQAYGTLSVSVVRLRNADFTKDIKVNDEDIKKYFDSRKEEMKTDEKRKVEFVNLSLTDEQKKLKGKEHVDVLQKLADRATDFVQALSEKGADFHQVAAKFQLPVQATGEFTEANPDPKLSSEGQLGATAFQLTEQEPNSEPVQAADGYYILHLAGVTPSRALTIDEAKPKIVDALKASRAREAMTNKGAQASREIREGLKAGEPLSFACEKVNVKAEKVAPFVLLDEAESGGDKDKDKEKDKEKRPSDFLAIKNAAGALQPGDVSEFFPWEDGGIIAVLEKRDPPDEAKYKDKKKTLADRILRNKRDVVFYEWLHERQLEAGVISEKDQTGPPPPVKKS